MWVRGAPLIGATAAYGLALQMNVAADDAALRGLPALAEQARPTAVNLAWALQRMLAALRPLPVAARPMPRLGRWPPPSPSTTWPSTPPSAATAWRCCRPWRREAPRPGERADALQCRLAGHRRLGHRHVADLPGAGWGLPLHVWVDETRPRNQGASLTAWELGQQGVPHTVIADNAGGHLMQHGQVDIVIVGCDRVSARGDVCNKIGTYLKALAAHDNGVPFYAAMPCQHAGPALHDGLAEIPIEERSAREVTHLTGRNAAGELVEVQLVPDGSTAANPAFDVTPARLVTG
jgi:methylthioribose-1-phosphate isomerase